jgi:hypothetical protein
VTFALFLGAFLLMFIGYAALTVSHDRKRKPYVLFAGESGDVVHTEQNLSVKQAVETASRAINFIGGAKISVGDGPIVVGWIGKTMSNIPSRQEYELMVLVTETGEDSAEFRCVVRPRFSGSWGGASRSAALRDQLIRKISSMR